MFEDRTMLDPAAGQPPAADPNRTQFADEAPAAPAAYGEATQQGISIPCAVCQTPNPPGERWCRDCGFMLGSTPVEVGEAPDASTQPRLVAAADGGREYALNEGVNSVGRENADVLVMDPQVSRSHARLTLSGESLSVEDLGSTNGTKVAGRRLGAGESVALYDGDEVRFGNTTLRVVIPGGSARPAGEAAPPAAEPKPDRGEPVAALVREDGEELPVYAGRNTLGRRSENDVCLTGDPYVSGRHAELVVENGEYRLTDLGSTNGTFIDGERLPAGEPRTIPPAGKFQVGKTSVTLKVMALPPPVEGEIVDEEPVEPAPETDATLHEFEIPGETS